MTAIELIPMIGNSPCASRDGSIWMPWIAPVMLTPASPPMLVTLADSVSVKLAGSSWMSGHVMPIDWIWIGRKLGHWNDPPVEEPTLSATPKPGRVSKLPSPRNAKLFAVPVIDSDPIFTVAPTELNDTIG